MTRIIENMRFFILSLLPLWFCSAEVIVPQMNESKEATAERLQWFRDAKFGLFIHWGPAAISGEEISWGMMDRIEAGAKHQKVPREEYMNLYKEFNPTKFDADGLLSLAKDAGMEYIVFVTKHHDGFSLWNTEEEHFPANSDYPQSYSIADTDYGKDICKEVQEATNKYGLKLGWYYSTRDWTHPDYLQGDNEAYNSYYENQVEELLTDYGKVDIMWFDHCFGEWSQYSIPRLYEKMYTHNPQLLVNNRAVRGIKDVPKEFDPLARGDYDTPENRMGAFQYGRPWESCMILSPAPDHGGWSYRTGSETRSLTETLRLLSSCVAGDGNMLLNLAPLPDGSLKPEERAVLEGIAPWIKTYGEAIYETRGGPWINGDWGGSTHKGEIVYLHLFDEGTIELNRLPQSVLKVETMEGVAVPFTQGEHTVSIQVPQEAMNEHVSIVKLTLDAAVDGPLFSPALAKSEANVIPGTLDFTPEQATLTEGLELEEGAITGWADPQNTISWDLGLASPGRYKVELTTSCTEPGSIIVVNFSAKSVKGVNGPVPVTGKYENFQTYSLGEVYFPNAESMKLRLKAGHPHAWKRVDVKGVRLTPSN